jgi:hypothetical protein
MDERWDDPFEEAIDEALESLPANFRKAISNLAIVVEDEPPDGRPLLGLYRGTPLTRRAGGTAECFPTRSASSADPLRDSLPATPIVCAARSDRSCSASSRIISGSSDARLIELDRY